MRIRNPARSAATAIVLLALLPGAASASGPRALAAQDAPVELAAPAGPDSGGPPSCRPSRTRLCGNGQLTPAAAAQRLLTTLSRRGLGFRPGSALVGRERARRADRRLAAARGAPATAAARTAQAAAPTIADALEQRTSVTKGKAREQRRFAWRAKIERCPDPGPPTNTHGRVKLQAGAILEVTHDEPRRGAVVRTITRMETKLDTSAASDNRANLDYVGDFGKANDVTVTQQVLVIRNGSSRRAGRTAVIEMTADTFSPDVGVQLKSDGFDAFIERMQAQERGEPAPDADGPIVGAAWKSAVRDFMQVVAARALQVARLAEAHWRTPNRCFAFKLDGPSKLRPGQRVELAGKVTPGERGGTARSVLGSSIGSGTWTVLRAPKGKRMESLVSKLPLPDDKPWIAYFAPDRRWKKGAEPSVEMTIATKAGIGSTTKVFEEGLPDRFTGTIASTFTTTGIDQTWNATVGYDLVTRQDNPDGSVLGLYNLTTQSTSITENLDAAVCGTYRFSGSPGELVSGELELQIAPDGTQTYGFLFDVKFANAVYAHVGPVPMGCPGSSSGLAKAVLNSNTLANGLRAVASDGGLVQATTSDLAANAIPVIQTTGSWTLAPG